MLVEESAIQSMLVPDHWSPLCQTAAAPGPGYAPPSLPEHGPALPRQFAALLAEVLAGVRPERHLSAWLSRRGSVHLHRLMPLFTSDYQPRVLRVITTRPAPDVVEMTVIVVIGPRPRALAIRLERGAQPHKWLCTDIEAA